MYRTRSIVPYKLGTLRWYFDPNTAWGFMGQVVVMVAACPVFSLHQCWACGIIQSSLNIYIGSAYCKGGSMMLCTFTIFFLIEIFINFVKLSKLMWEPYGAHLFKQVSVVHLYVGVCGLHRGSLTFTFCLVWKIVGDLDLIFRLAFVLNGT